MRIQKVLPDIINYLEENKKEGLILIIDFQKAFDLLEWKYINLVLLAYNFGKCYRKWFKILYNNSCSIVINNGYLFESFPLERGWRQGDPLSPCIFILTLNFLFVCLFGVLRCFQHCTGHITTGSWKGRGNQYIEFARVVYCKLPTNGKQLPAFPLTAMMGIEPRPQRWEAKVSPLCHRGLNLLP